MTTDQRLKLIAEDPADLTVLAACLQDALVPVSDMAWLKDEGRFALAVNRFMWERPAEPAGTSGEVYHRTHALVRIDGVKAVRSRGYDRRDRSRILSLLSVRPVDGGVDFVFSDDAVLRIEADPLAIALVDMGDPWPTRWKPGHEGGEAEG